METTVQNQPSRVAVPLVAFAIGGSTAFGVVYYGLPLLGAIEQGPGIRIGLGFALALFVGIASALLARGRSVAAAADAALTGEASPGLLKHRSSRKRARWIGSGVLLASTGLVYLALGELYVSLNADRYEWDQLELGRLELGISVFIALMIATIVWRILDPGRYVDDIEEYVPVGDGASTISDDELERTAAAVRAHQTRASLAMLGGFVASVGTMLGLGYGTVTLEVDGGAFTWMAIFGLGIAAGVIVNRAVGPTVDIEDIGADPVDLPTGAGVTPPTFAESLEGAQSLQVGRRSGLLRFLGLEGSRSYGVSADDVALADGTETQTLLGRLLPASLAPYLAEISDDDSVVMQIEGEMLSPRFTVREGGETIGTIEGGFFGRRYELRAGDATLTIAGSFWNRKELALLSADERVGYVQISGSRNALESLLSGSEVRLHMELPGGTPVALRRLLLAALLVIDHRHF